MRVRQIKICKEILLCFRRSSGFYGSQDVNPFSINNLQYQTNGKCIRHQRKFQLNVFSPSFQIRCNLRSKFWKMFVKSLLYLDTVIILVWKSLTFYRFIRWYKIYFKNNTEHHENGPQILNQLMRDDLILAIIICWSHNFVKYIETSDKSVA